MFLVTGGQSVAIERVCLIAQRGRIRANWMRLRSGIRGTDDEKDSVQGLAEWPNKGDVRMGAERK